jgi:hypothetical protein
LRSEIAKRPGVIARRSEATTRQSSARVARQTKKQLSVPQMLLYIFEARLPACRWIASLRSQ